MIDVGTGSLLGAFRDGYAIGGFNVYNLEGALGVRQAAEEVRAPVMLQTGSAALEHGGEALVALCLATARAATVPVGVHLDHSRQVSEIAECLRVGYTSVMVDGSHLPFEENVGLTAEVVELARKHGAWVEGELGRVTGDEDVSGAAESDDRTDPKSAEEFVARTGVDALAIAVGNVHGRTEAPPELDLRLLADIRSRVVVPLVLHGASGLASRQTERALQLGVAKINVNTDLRRGLFRAIDSEIDATRRGWDLASLSEGMVGGVRSVVESKLRELGAVGAAP